MNTLQEIEKIIKEVLPSKARVAPPEYITQKINALAQAILTHINKKYVKRLSEDELQEEIFEELDGYINNNKRGSIAEVIAKAIIKKQEER